MASKNKLTVSQIAKRAGITARELRDVVTSVSTAGKVFGQGQAGSKAGRTVVKDIGKQVKEVGKAATTGKKGTTPMTFKPGAAKKGYTGVSNPDFSITKTKRK